MAHGNYECCAVCDNGICFNENAEAKESICADCAAEFGIQHGLRITSQFALLDWMSTEVPEKVLKILEKLNFSICSYSNPVDALFKKLKETTS